MLPDGNKCTFSTFKENENCVYNWIIQNKPNEIKPLINNQSAIIIPANTTSITYIGTNGVSYFVYSNGTVTTGSPQKVILPTGGISGLVQWLSVNEPSVVVIGNNNSTVQVTPTVTKDIVYIDG